MSAAPVNYPTYMKSHSHHVPRIQYSSRFTISLSLISIIRRLITLIGNSCELDCFSRLAWLLPGHVFMTMPCRAISLELLFSMRVCDAFDRSRTSVYWLTVFVSFWTQEWEWRDFRVLAHVCIFFYGDCCRRFHIFGARLLIVIGIDSID